MFNKFFKTYPDFSVTEKPVKQVIDNYKDKFPAELVKFWREYGFGIYMDGYLKLVNPEIYQPILNEGYNTENNKEIVFAVTGLGDFVAWVVMLYV
ncbi:GAD-like domain-containing protein [Pedobacter sp. NJ-S-72]